MVGLTSEANSQKSSLMSSLSSPCTVKSEPEVSVNTSPLHSSPLIYVRYKDHVIYKNIKQHSPEALERETVGWLTQQNQDILLVTHDRIIQPKEISSAKSNGIIILRSCILEFVFLPLQENSKWHLNSQNTKRDYEYALQPKKRKTHSSKGAKTL